MDDYSSRSTRPAEERLNQPPEQHPALVPLLISRIEELARALGRVEGQRAVLEEQLARLEAQLISLERQGSRRLDG